MQNKIISDSELTTLQKELITLIAKEYKTVDLETKLSLKKRYLLEEYYNLIKNGKEILTEENYQFILNEYKNNCYFKEFPEGKIVFISDTHLASKHENIEYLNQVKDFLRENEIDYLLDGGDIGDGMVRYSNRYPTYPKQLDHILEVYKFDHIKHFVLGGNHDAKYKRKNPDYDLLNLLEENNPNIEAVGYFQAYFKLGCNTVSFQHASKYSGLIARDFSILGHSHYLSYKDSTVILPTLSDSFPNSQRPKESGFIVLDYQNNNNHANLEFTNYKTTSNGIEKGKVKRYQLR